MRTIRVEASTATILLTEAPEPKVRDRQTGEVAKDATTGEALMKVGVVYIDEGQSSLIHVAVPESGVSEGLTLGAPVSLPGLIARPWESVFNGRQRHGIAFRAAALTAGAVPASVGADFRFYDLRHAGHTLATQVGATLKDTMVRAGQSSERASLIYQHSDRKRQHEIAAALDARVAEEREKGAARPSGADLVRDV